jgi:hypothetical protein
MGGLRGGSVYLEGHTFYFQKYFMRGGDVNLMAREVK